VGREEASVLKRRERQVRREENLALSCHSTLSIFLPLKLPLDLSVHRDTLMHSRRASLPALTSTCTPPTLTLLLVAPKLSLSTRSVNKRRSLAVFESCNNDEMDHCTLPSANQGKEYDWKTTTTENKVTSTPSYCCWYCCCCCCCCCCCWRRSCCCCWACC
jgi:hypothetical protein